MVVLLFDLKYKISKCLGKIKFYNSKLPIRARVFNIGTDAQGFSEFASTSNLKITGW